MNYFQSLIILLFLVLVSSCEVNEKTTTPKSHHLAYSPQIDAIFKDFDKEGSPGYALGITKGNKLLYAKGYGMANLDYDIPITPTTVFSIASVSKQFTAACIALLIIEGKLSLETDASEFIPALKKYPETIQIKHLIYNTSGITDYFMLPRSNGKSWVTFNYFSIDECIQTALSQDKLAFKPGEKWDYCNVNFMLMAKIVEKVSGKSFKNFMQERLFYPLDMKHSFVNDDITQIVKNRATPYNIRNADYVKGYANVGIHINEEGSFLRHPRVSPHYGGSGVMTTIEDLAKWSINFHTKSFGGDEFYQLMHKTIKFEYERDNQAFGLYHGDFNGRAIVAWDGGDWGISAQLLRFPNEGVSIICLSNLGSGEAFRKVNQVADILIQEKEL